MIASARALCEALARAELQVHAPDRARLLVSPRTRVTDDIACLIKRFKPELISALFRLRAQRIDGAIAPCQACDCEFVHASETRCPWCEVADVPLFYAIAVIEPVTAKVQSAPETTVLTVPEPLKTHSQGQLGQLGHSTGVIRTHARA